MKERETNEETRIAVRTIRDFGVKACSSLSKRMSHTQWRQKHANNTFCRVNSSTIYYMPSVKGNVNRWNRFTRAGLRKLCKRRYMQRDMISHSVAVSQRADLFGQRTSNFKKRKQLLMLSSASCDGHGIYDIFGALVVPTDPYVVWCREELSFYKALGPVNGLLGVGDARGVWMHDARHTQVPSVWVSCGPTPEGRVLKGLQLEAQYSSTLSAESHALSSRSILRGVNARGCRPLALHPASFARPPSSSLSYPGPGNDDVRSPGSGGTPGPLSQQPSSQQSVDNSDPDLSSHSSSFQALHSNAGPNHFCELLADSHFVRKRPTLDISRAVLLELPRNRIVAWIHVMLYRALSATLVGNGHCQTETYDHSSTGDRLVFSPHAKRSLKRAYKISQMKCIIMFLSVRKEIPNHLPEDEAKQTCTIFKNVDDRPIMVVHTPVLILEHWTMLVAVDYFRSSKPRVIVAIDNTGPSVMAATVMVTPFLLESNPPNNVTENILNKKHFPPFSKHAQVPWLGLYAGRGKKLVERTQFSAAFDQEFVLSQVDSTLLNVKANEALEVAATPVYLAQIQPTPRTHIRVVLRSAKFYSDCARSPSVYHGSPLEISKILWSPDMSNSVVTKERLKQRGHTHILTGSRQHFLISTRQIPMLGFEVFTAVSPKMAVFWVLAPCALLVLAATIIEARNRRRVSLREKEGDRCLSVTYRREESHCLGYEMTIRDSALRSKETGKCSEIPSSQSFLDAPGYEYKLTNEITFTLKSASVDSTSALQVVICAYGLVFSTGRQERRSRENWVRDAYCTVSKTTRCNGSHSVLQIYLPDAVRFYSCLKIRADCKVAREFLALTTLHITLTRSLTHVIYLLSGHKVDWGWGLQGETRDESKGSDVPSNLILYHAMQMYGEWSIAPLILRDCMEMSALFWHADDVCEWLVAAVDGLLSEASWPAIIAPPATTLDDDDVEDYDRRTTRMDDKVKGVEMDKTCSTMRKPLNVSRGTYSDKSLKLFCCHPMNPTLLVTAFRSQICVNTFCSAPPSLSFSTYETFIKLPTQGIRGGRPPTVVRRMNTVRTKPLCFIKTHFDILPSVPSSSKWCVPLDKNLGPTSYRLPYAILLDSTTLLGIYFYIPETNLVPKLRSGDLHNVCLDESIPREVVPDAAGMALASGRASGGERHPQGRLVFVRLPGQPRLGVLALCGCMEPENPYDWDTGGLKLIQSRLSFDQGDYEASVWAEHTLPVARVTLECPLQFPVECRAEGSQPA
ncbi:Homeobox protein homothorax [Zootermopsis nevadensis]|uniref:Homeobox protein homothorax n=1 Tax=Zootermopsis nevadensis TaxID=136037 RepID=A0A067RGA1_ZOONE|nr:Homeobox protein homothorax [Zootermopsis nevadensis]